MSNTSPITIDKTLMAYLITNTTPQKADVYYDTEEATIIDVYPYSDDLYMPFFNGDGDLMFGVKYRKTMSYRDMMNILTLATNNEETGIRVWNYDGSSKFYKYKYNIGVDNISIENKNTNMNSCYIFKEIDLNSITKDTYIQLSANYVAKNNCSIEFYIIDGGKTYPILPIEDSIVTREKIFPGLPTRFEIDKSFPYKIFNAEGLSIDNPNLEEIFNNPKGHTITYTPLNAQKHIVTNNKINIKTILRLYDKNSNSPIINRLEIKKFGGDGLWKSTI